MNDVGPAGIHASLLLRAMETSRTADVLAARAHVATCPACRAQAMAMGARLQSAMALRTAEPTPERSALIEFVRRALAREVAADTPADRGLVLCEVFFGDAVGELQPTAVQAEVFSATIDREGHLRIDVFLHGDLGVFPDCSLTVEMPPIVLASDRPLNNRALLESTLHAWELPDELRDLPPESEPITLPGDQLREHVRFVLRRPGG